MSVDKMSVDKMSVDKTSVDKMSVYKSTLCCRCPPTKNHFSRPKSSMHLEASISLNIHAFNKTML
jgi:hypothetical protein